MRILSTWGKFRLFLGRAPLIGIVASIAAIISIVQVVLALLNDSEGLEFIIPLILSLGVLGVKSLNFKRNYHILQVGAFTKAKVVKASRTIIMINYNRVFDYKLTYMVGNREFHFHKSSSNLKSWKKGAKIGIHYLPESPQKIMIPSLYGIKRSYVTLLQSV